MKLYSYVIAVDAGSAPNFDPPLATLAICKPQIRKTAKIGDVVLAFAGRDFGRDPDSVVWLGGVVEKVTFGQYWKDARFESKKPAVSETPDNIYRLKNGALCQIPNHSHSGHQQSEDLSGQFVLVMDPVWHFETEERVLPDVFPFRMGNARRGHRKFEILPSEWLELRRWLGAPGKPFSKLTRPKKPGFDQVVPEVLRNRHATVTKAP